MRNKAFRTALMSMLIVSAPFISRAEDLGNYGPAWTIAEPDAIESIKNKIRRLERDGTLKKRQEEYKNKSIAGIKNPPPLPGITTSTFYRSRRFDPTYVYPEDVRDETGKILVRAGTKINPLDYQPLGKRLIFIDGRDRSQVAYAKKIVESNIQDKIILTAGSFIDLTKELKRHVYFDQRGVLTQHFKIKSVPTMITQTGNILMIEEGIRS